jgi:hypothetical protein
VQSALSVQLLDWHDRQRKFAISGSTFSHRAGFSTGHLGHVPRAPHKMGPPQSHTLLVCSLQHSCSACAKRHTFDEKCTHFNALNSVSALYIFPITSFIFNSFCCVLHVLTFTNIAMGATGPHIKSALGPKIPKSGPVQPSIMTSCDVEKCLMR